MGGLAEQTDVAVLALPRETALLWPRTEALLIAAAALALFAVYAWAARYWIDLADEGYFLYLASRVYQGDLPYRDFDTYYTPGVFYLYAALFKLFGVSVMPIRVFMAGARAVCALLLYGLARRLAPWPFALLPFALIALVDPIPVFPEPHPAWMALLATLATLELLLRHHAGQRLGWIAFAGLMAGLTFAFKQNCGAFAALALGGYILLRRREPVGRLVLAAQALYVLALAVGVTLFLWPALDDLVAATMWLPTLATLGILLRSAWTRVRVDGWTPMLRPILVETGVAAGAYAAITLLWLAPLTLGLGVGATPFGLFLGAVNQGALILPLEAPPRLAHPIALAAIWLPLGVALLPWRRIGGRGWLLAAAILVSLLVPWMPTVTGPRVPLTEDPNFYPWLGFLYEHLDTLYLYLPALGAWAGLILIAPRAWRGLLPGLPGWYLLVGTLAALAIHPRVDTLHAMFAGPPLFVVAVWGLARAHRALAGGASFARQAAVYAALLVIPAAAVAPHAYWRYVTIVHADPRSPTPPPYVSLGLERAPTLAPKHIADAVRGVVEYVQAGTPPGQPFFSYPADPLFNFLADRPNPTRFDHFLPGALTRDDMATVIDRLETARPRYVLWDHNGVWYWETDLTNRPLSDYIWRCYRQVANFTPYLILERQEC